MKRIELLLFVLLLACSRQDRPVVSVPADSLQQKLIPGEIRINDACSCDGTLENSIKMSGRGGILHPVSCLGAVAGLKIRDIIEIIAEKYPVADVSIWIHQSKGKSMVNGAIFRFRYTADSDYFIEICLDSNSWLPLSGTNWDFDPKLTIDQLNIRLYNRLLRSGFSSVRHCIQGKPVLVPDAE